MISVLNVKRAKEGKPCCAVSACAARTIRCRGHVARHAGV